MGLAIERDALGRADDNSVYNYECRKRIFDCWSIALCSAFGICVICSLAPQKLVIFNDTRNVELCALIKAKQFLVFHSVIWHFGIRIYARYHFVNFDIDTIASSDRSSFPMLIDSSQAALSERGKNEHCNRLHN